MARTIRIGYYHPSNPKIDVFVGGKYAYSTNWYTRLKDALAHAPAQQSGAKITGKIDRR